MLFFGEGLLKILWIFRVGTFWARKRACMCVCGIENYEYCMRTRHYCCCCANGNSGDMMFFCFQCISAGCIWLLVHKTFISSDRRFQIGVVQIWWSDFGLYETEAPTHRWEWKGLIRAICYLFIACWYEVMVRCRHRLRAVWSRDMNPN